jgi:hypothetical protein
VLSPSSTSIFTILLFLTGVGGLMMIGGGVCGILKRLVSLLLLYLFQLYDGTNDVQHRIVSNSNNDYFGVVALHYSLSVPSKN